MFMKWRVFYPIILLEYRGYQFNVHLINHLENDDPGGLDDDGQDNVDDEDEDSDEDDIKITIDHKEIDDAKTSYQVIMK